MTSDHLSQYVTELRIAKFSPDTIDDRLSVLRRLAAYLDKPLLEATGCDLRGYQASFAALSPASVDIYTRHMKAFYDWAAKRQFIAVNPAEELIPTRVPRGRPHPTRPDDLRLIFACTDGALRMAYLLAAFVGLRCGEICRMHSRDLDLSEPAPTGLIHGKGGKERTVPLLAPVVAELHGVRGWVVTKHGLPYSPERLSIDSTRHLHRLGLATTLHSMRGTFATTAGRVTRDPLFVRDLLGHESVATTEIYMQSNLADAHQRLAGLTDQAEQLLAGTWQRLRAVPDA